MDRHEARGVQARARRELPAKALTAREWRFRIRRRGRPVDAFGQISSERSEWKRAGTLRKTDADFERFIEFSALLESTR